MIYMKSLNQHKTSNKFGLHNSFYIDIDLNEIGKIISENKINKIEFEIDRFFETFTNKKNKTKKLSFI